MTKSKDTHSRMKGSTTSSQTNKKRSLQLSADKLRSDGRRTDQLRPIKMTPHCADYAEGSVLVEFGQTRVMCTASFEAKPPSWLIGSGRGWVTAEYGMLPRSTHQRIKREKASTSGRTQEISRLIGRSLRAGIDLSLLGERQIIVDCDVLNADGGTRTASVTGGFVALALACQKLLEVGEIKKNPLTHYVAAVSVGLVEDHFLLDLNFDEDSAISTDMNFVMTHQGHFVEVQGTAEEQAFTKDELFAMMGLAETGCQVLFQEQQKQIGDFFPIP